MILNGAFELFNLFRQLGRLLGKIAGTVSAELLMHHDGRRGKLSEKSRMLMEKKKYCGGLTVDICRSSINL